MSVPQSAWDANVASTRTPPSADVPGAVSHGVIEHSEAVATERYNLHDLDAATQGAEASDAECATERSWVDNFCDELLAGNDVDGARVVADSGPLDATKGFPDEAVATEGFLPTEGFTDLLKNGFPLNSGDEVETGGFPGEMHMTKDFLRNSGDEVETGDSPQVLATPFISPDGETLLLNVDYFEVKVGKLHRERTAHVGYNDDNGLILVRDGLADMFVASVEVKSSAEFRLCGRWADRESVSISVRLNPTVAAAFMAFVGCSYSVTDPNVQANPTVSREPNAANKAISKKRRAKKR